MAGPIRMALSSQSGPVSIDPQNPKAELRSRDERAPLDQCGRASLFVNLAGHEMPLLVEMIVDLSMN